MGNEYMEWVIWIIVSVLLVLVGGIGCIFYFQSRKISDGFQRQKSKESEELVELKVLLSQLGTELREKDIYIQEFRDRMAVNVCRREKLEHEVMEDSKQLNIVSTQLEEKIKQSESYKQWWQLSDEKIETLQMEYNQLKERYILLQSEQEMQQSIFKEKISYLEKSKTEMKTEFEQLASEILEKKVVSFKEVNKESVQNLLNPIHLELKKFKEQVEKTHHIDVEQRVQIKTEMQNLQRINQGIMERSDKLVTVLQGQKKIQGNWGELILESVLDGAGLRSDTDYKRELTFNTEDGRKRPDVVVYLPKNKHLIIDAKTSLASYTKYVNSDNEQERVLAIKQHIKAIETHINDLSSKEYYRLPGINSPEVVIMFIPVESAYVEALKYDPTLFQRAIDKNILVTTPTTLLTSLNIVRQLWQFEKQNKSSAELIARAEMFYKKLNGFLSSMTGVGEQLDKAKEYHVKAMSQLYSGKGNLIKKAYELKDFGVSIDKELPERLVEKSKMEIPYTDNG